MLFSVLIDQPSYSVLCVNGDNNDDWWLWC